MTDSSSPMTQPSSNEKILSEEDAKAKFGEALVQEVQEAFAEDAVAAFSAEGKDSVPPAKELEAPIPPSVQGDSAQDAASLFEAANISPADEEAEMERDETLSQPSEHDQNKAQDAADAFSSEETGNLSEAQADLKADLKIEEAPAGLSENYLFSDRGIQSVLSVFWEGFQHSEVQREAFFREAFLKEEIFRFFPVRTDPEKSPLFAAGMRGELEGSEIKKTDIPLENAKSLAQLSLQMSQLTELRRHAVTLLSWCIGLFSVSVLVGAVIFSAPHISQGKATLLAFILTVPVVTMVLTVVSLGRIWEYFTFIQGSGNASTELTHSLLSDAGDFLSEGREGLEKKLLQNRNSLLNISTSLEQAVQRLILTGGLAAFSAVIWMSLAISSTFQKFISWEHVGFFVVICLVLFVAAFFVRIGRWKEPSSGKTWGWCFALAIFIVTLFGAGAIARGPIRVDVGEMPEISSSWLHNFSPNGFFEGLRGWFYPGIALQRVPPKS